MYVTKKKSTANINRKTDRFAWHIESACGKLCWLTWLLQNQEVSGLQQRFIVSVLSVTEWLVSNVAARILIRT